MVYWKITARINATFRWMRMMIKVAVYDLHETFVSKVMPSVIHRNERCFTKSFQSPALNVQIYRWRISLMQGEFEKSLSTKYTIAPTPVAKIR